MAEELWAGRYRRERLLGRGAMGEVWLALDVVLDRRVAIKSISASSTDADDLERMAREARVAARIGHPNAVSVYDLVTVDGRPNLVMEYVDGETLADRIKREGRLPPQQVAVLGAAVADALAEAHRLGVVHRDIKPANILITPRGVPKLADFGIARMAGEANMTATGFMVGTPAYMSPEIVEGAPPGPTTDMWSLGVTLYAALEGSPPFVFDPHDEPFVVLARVMNAPVRPPSCGGAIARAVSSMLERDPSRRPSAEQAAGLLRDQASALPGHETSLLPRPGRAPTQRLAPPPPPPFTPDFRPGGDSGDRPGNGSAGYAGAGYAGAGYEGGAYGSGGSGPLLPGTWSTGSSPVPAGRGRRVWPAVVAVLVVLLVVAGVAAYLVTQHSGGGSASADGSSAPSSPQSSSSTATSSSSPATTSTAPTSTSGTPTPSADEKYYSGPGGITVIAPDGWRRDNSAGIPNVRDYVSPESEDRTTGTFFRVGIGNPNTTTSIDQVANDAVNFLRNRKLSGYRDLELVGSVLSTDFLGHPGATIEYTATNSDGVPRHGKEQLWLDGGITKEIIVSSPADGWTQAAPVFQRLVETARESS